MQNGVMELLTVGDAALIVGQSPDAIRDAAAKGWLAIAATTPNGNRLFTPSEVQRYKRAREARRNR